MFEQKSPLDLSFFYKLTGRMEAEGRPELFYPAAVSYTHLWYKYEAEQIIPAGEVCEKCGASEWTKDTDIMDVWFDSGSTHAAVLEAVSYTHLILSPAVQPSRRGTSPRRRNCWRWPKRSFPARCRRSARMAAPAYSN